MQKHRPPEKWVRTLRTTEPLAHGGRPRTHAGLDAGHTRTTSAHGAYMDFEAREMAMKRR